MISRDEAIKMHRDMWNWMATVISCHQKPLSIIALKKKYLKEHHCEDIYMGCFCCEYCDEHHLLCNDCLVDWGEDRTCTSFGSPFMVVTTTQDWKEQYKACREISELPLRDGREDIMKLNAEEYASIMVALDTLIDKNKELLDNATLELDRLTLSIVISEITQLKDKVNLPEFDLDGEDAVNITCGLNLLNRRANELLKLELTDRTKRLLENDVRKNYMLIDKINEIDWRNLHVHNSFKC